MSTDNRRYPLALQVKIQNLKKQREFIIHNLLNNPTGNSREYFYPGQVFPEVRDYFVNEGFVVETKPIKFINGLKLYFTRFCISKKLTLTEAQLAESEEVPVPCFEHLDSTGAFSQGKLLKILQDKEAELMDKTLETEVLYEMLVNERTKRLDETPAATFSAESESS